MPSFYSARVLGCALFVVLRVCRGLLVSILDDLSGANQVARAPSTPVCYGHTAAELLNACQSGRAAHLPTSVVEVLVSGGGVEAHVPFARSHQKELFRPDLKFTNLTSLDEFLITVSQRSI